MTTVPAPITSRFGARSTALDVVDGLDLHDRNIIVTGGAAGLGLETTRALVHAGANVTMAVRNRAQGDAAIAALRVERVRVMPLDLADLTSVCAFVDGWGAMPLHALINNAAIMACPLTRTTAGWEAQLATNHIGHTALTNGLLPALRRGAPSRLVALSSAAHMMSTVDLDDPHFERRPYNKWKAYGQAKSANALMALAVDDLFASDGITANAVHPGGIMTGLQQHLSDDELRATGLVNADGTANASFKTPSQGAATSTWAATAPELAGHGGLYFEDCRQGLPQVKGERWSGVAPYITDRDLARRLWAWTVAQI